MMHLLQNKYKLITKYKLIAPFFGLLVLSLALTVTINGLSQRQDVRSKAAAYPVDADGVSMIFPYKAGGPTWNLGTRNPNSTVGTYFNMNGDKATAKSENSINFWRLNGHGVSYANGQPSGITTRIHLRSGETQKYTWQNGAITKGFLGGPRDLKNFEATIFVRVSGNNLTHKSMNWLMRGGAHTSGALSSSVLMNVPYNDDYGTKKTQFSRELTHPNYEYVDLKRHFNYSLQAEQWVGVKVVSYLLPGGTSVQYFLYLDTTPYDATGKPANNWQLYTDWIDHTGYSTGNYKQAATWGGVVNTFRVDGWKNVDFSILSIREIVPPTTAPATLSPDKVYNFVNKSSGNAMDVAGGKDVPKTNVWIWPFDGKFAQEWKAQLNSDGTYTFINPNSGLALDAAGAASGSNVQIFTPNGLNNQKWRVYKNLDGTYTLINANGNWALDANGTASKSNVRIFTANWTDFQRWSIIEDVPPASSCIPSTTPTCDVTPTETSLPTITSLPTVPSDPTPTGLPTPTAVPTPTDAPTSVPTPTKVPTSAPTSSVGITSTFYSLADSNVRSDAKTRNYGGSTTLYVDTGSPISISYVKFDLSSLAGKIVKDAYLEMRTGTDASAGKQNVKATGSSWGERSITYNNRPALGATLGIISSGNKKSAWQKLPVASYVQQNVGTMISFAIDTSSTDGIYLDSRETSNDPKLTVVWY